ncbi:MAG TPA: Crp/Fnr family transcriptional regulator [Chitinophaga sp.]|uniref:Crp/Fnr family transcriptional regulator n=1 Tax=Chitinophaga sp. TaxID=1869181 RepID=UPI002BE33FE2|nr:Crp/Fnr family transcriptional regulator [Chitinophaga sp.]HVI46428.1 Crp/Fnr family transcriptional regulator [Chitinophaga sp.]
MNEDNGYNQLISHVQRHITLTSAEIDYFTSLLRTRKILRRQFLLQAGDVCKYESYVVKGCLRAFYIDRSGQEHTLHFAVEDWWISDFASFFRGTPATRDIEALETSEVIQIDKASLDALYKEVPAFERFFRILHQNACVAQDERILSNISMTGAERYEALLKKYPQFAQRVPQKHIASFLGITPVFLSQIRNKLSQQ